LVESSFKSLTDLAARLGKELTIVKDSSGKITGVYENIREAVTVPLPDSGIMGIAKMLQGTKKTVDELFVATKKLNVSFTQTDMFGPMAAGLDAYTNKLISSEKAMRAFVLPMHDGVANAQKLGLAIIDVGDIMSNVMVGGITAFADAFGQAIAGVGNFGDTIIHALLGFAKTVGQILVQAGTAVLVTKKFLVANPLAAIAAGAALIAIAAGAQSKIKSAAGGIGGSGGGGGGGGASSGSRSENIGQRIELQVAFTGDAGKVLKAQMIKQDRIDSRTRS